jgi:hypothetical protein
MLSCLNLLTIGMKRLGRSAPLPLLLQLLPIVTALVCKVRYLQLRSAP